MTVTALKPLTATDSWRVLRTHREQIAGLRMVDEFADDAGRASRFSLEAAGIFLDYSKNLVTRETMALLTGLARERGVEQKRDAMLRGEHINNTEDRAVLHMALRNPRSSGRRYTVAGHDVGPEVAYELGRMQAFAEQVRSGRWLGHSGQVITDIVNIGIGGSDLGPQMVCEALRVCIHPRLKMHFVSNVDAADLLRVLPQIDAASTLFIISSKTFRTSETLTNARSARAWFMAQGGTGPDVAKHFVAVSTNAEAVAAFGIDVANMFRFWDWVGGRYSLWSAIGLPIVLAIGFDGFQQLLAGAHAMDEHFAEAPVETNMPMLLALLGLWYVNFHGVSSQCVAPYSQSMHRLPAYLQQLEMESNGKSVDADGNALTVASCPVIWGEPGSNGQHAYFQLLHQGSSVIPVDFIAVVKDHSALPDHHRLLLANCFAQSEALMLGRSAVEAGAELRQGGMNATAALLLTPHKVFTGNRPSNTILLPELSPAALGALIALYEHKVFTQGAIWGVNSFDQWGVELGKQLAVKIDGELKAGSVSAGHDGSTAALMRRFIR